MVISAKFYYHDKGKYFDLGGNLVIKNRFIVKLGNLPIEKEGRKFYYDNTDLDIFYEVPKGRYKVQINRIITESSYRSTQREYLVSLNWFQKQRLLWMFRRNWFQQPSNVIHLFVGILIISFAFMGLHFVTN